MKTSEALAKLRGKVTTKPKDKLSAIAALINIEHKAALRSVRDGLGHAIKAGELLIRAKEKVKHGEWVTWVEKNCDFAERTAQAYMQVARKPQRVALLSFREALKTFAEPSVHFSSESVEWRTPREIVERVTQALGHIALDPCADKACSIPAETSWTKEQDGLTAGDWRGTVYMNPPYGAEIGAWVHRLCEQYAVGNVTEAIALVPARVDTEWFRMFRDFAVCFVSGRLKFGGHSNSAPFPSAVVYLGRNRDAFRKAFEPIGDVWVRLQD